MRRAVDVFFAWETESTRIAMAKMMEIGSRRLPAICTHGGTWEWTIEKLRTDVPNVSRKIWKNMGTTYWLDDPTLIQKISKVVKVST